MVLDKKNLKKLDHLAKKINNNTNSNQETNQNKTSTSNHPIETETDPKELFKLLISASPDGNIPKHLIDKLKTLESSHPAGTKNINQAKSSNQYHLKKNTEDENYILFKQLLLEDD